MKRSKKQKSKPSQRKSAKPKASKVEVVIKRSAYGESPTEKHFVVADGSRLRNIVELARALQSMSEEVFKHHVNEARNDFSNWVRDVFKDNVLAEELANAKDKAAAELILLRKIIKDFINM